MNGISNECKSQHICANIALIKSSQYLPYILRLLEMYPFLKHLNILKQKVEDTADMDRKEFYIPVVGVGR